MNSENRICQNCKNQFTIEPEDFLFYEKMKVPTPTFCSDCRRLRRMIWRNEKSLYKRQCDKCKKDIVSMYDKITPFPVYCHKCFRDDDWGGEEFAKEYDFSKPFFVQWRELFNKVPRLSLYQQGECINSEYANMVLNVKNVYLSVSATPGCEDVYYSNTLDNSKQIVDSYNVVDSELIYNSLGSAKNYNCQYSYWSQNCINCNFVFNCSNCQNCFGCVNLQNKNYYIWNKQCTKEEYEEKIKEFCMGSFRFVEKTLPEFYAFSLKFPRRYANIINSVSSVGDELKDCNNVLFSFNSLGSENIKYGYRCIKEKDAMDVCYNLSANLVYEHVLGSTNGYNVKFIVNGDLMLRDSEYCDFCANSSNLFGCITLRNKQYCILNKQYTKEEYEALVPKIIEHMNTVPYIDQKGRIYKYGEFFPSEFCPFAYNETVLNDFFPLSKEEISEQGYLYKEREENKYSVTLKATDIPDDIQNISDSILNEVIECAVSKRAFKITPFELQFYKRMNIPLPRLHPDERYKQRMELRNPIVLYHRSCMNAGCKNEFETPYNPTRPEIVYCKECYQKEVL